VGHYLPTLTTTPLARDLVLADALASAKEAAEWARELGVSRLTVRTDEAELSLELYPPTPLPEDWVRAIDQAEDPATARLVVKESGVSVPDERSAEAAFQRLIGDNYGLGS